MSWPFNYFKPMTLEEFRSKINYRTSSSDEKYYTCPMCGSSGPIEDHRDRYAEAYGVSRSSLDIIDDVELIYLDCLETQHRYPKPVIDSIPTA
jgi:hypothetical protein